MNSGKDKALPIYPKQAFQAGLGTCQSVINVPVTVTGASPRLAHPRQVDLVSKGVSAVAPRDLSRGWTLRGEKLLLGLKALTNPSPSWGGHQTVRHPCWTDLAHPQAADKALHFPWCILRSCAPKPSWVAWRHLEPTDLLSSLSAQEGNNNRMAESCTYSPFFFPPKCFFIHYLPLRSRLQRHCRYIWEGIWPVWLQRPGGEMSAYGSHYQLAKWAESAFPCCQSRPLPALAQSLLRRCPHFKWSLLYVWPCKHPDYLLG